MNIKLDTTLTQTKRLENNGIDLNDSLHVKYASDFQTVTTNLHENNYGFTSVIENDDVINECKKAYKSFEWAKQLVVIGIGGSDLGGRMLQEALQADMSPMKVYFVGDTTDPEQYRQLFTKIKAEETIVNVISKSGSTTETASGYLLLKKYMQKHVEEDWVRHFIFTTSPGGLLYSEAEKHNIYVLKHDDVGGRYSVLSKVGLFPALAMGVDIDKLVSGARNMLRNLKESSQSGNTAWIIALTQYLFAIEKDVHTVTLIPYIYRLRLFGNWFRQLWSESLGKEGKGVFPIRAHGPADQHSGLQYYNEGKWLSTFFFIKAKHYASEIVIENEQFEELDYLHLIPMEDIIKFECDATRYSLAKNDRPSMLIEITTLDEESLGEMILLFETAVVYLAQLFDINPFDQPGVEESKQYLYGMLGRPGYEDRLREIEKMRG